MSPRYTIVLENVLVSSVVGTSSSFSRNFANVNVDYAFGRAPCRSGADACLIEEDGIYPAGGVAAFRSDIRTCTEDGPRSGS